MIAWKRGNSMALSRMEVWDMDGAISQIPRLLSQGETGTGKGLSLLIAPCRIGCKSGGDQRAHFVAEQRPA